MARAHCIRYHLSFSNHSQNVVDIAVDLPCAAGKSHGQDNAAFALDVMMPVWAPGSYMVREFARHVQEVTAVDAAGHPLAVHKINKNTWRITAAAPTDVRLQYRVWGRELTVRSNCIEQDFALLQGAATYLSPAAAAGWPHEVRVQLPHAYAQLVCGAEVRTEGTGSHMQHVFTAQNFDELVDTPIALGCPDLQHFELDGVPHTLATFGGAGVFDAARAARDFRKIAACTSEMFGCVPYDRYVMINLLFGGQGGLEHRHSAVIMASPWPMRSEAVYQSYLGLIAHEHFHAWNIKRLRPKALGPFDYSCENHTESLWIAEGITAFYDNLMVVRAGLCDSASYLKGLSGDLARLLATPGRAQQTLAQASFDAWIKFYRRDENSDNTAISYYLKGAVVAMLLNAEIMHHSGNTRCLDDVMRLAYARYSGAEGFTEAQFRACVTEICKEVPERFLENAVDSTQELSLSTFCSTFGISQSAPPQDAGADNSSSPKVELGLALKEADGRLTVAQVTLGGPASRAGLQADDEILALGGYRMSQTTLGHWLQLAQAGQAAQVLISRYGVVSSRQLTPQKPERRATHLAWLAEPEKAQRAARSLWLGQGHRS